MIAETLVNVVSNVKPDNAGSPLRVVQGAVGPGVRALGVTRVRGAEGEKLSRGGPKNKAGFLEDESIDGGDEGFAVNVVFKLVAVVGLGAAKAATADLGLGASGGDPGVAPCTQNTGSDSRGGGFGNVDSFPQLVVEGRSACRSFIGIGKESADTGADGVGEVVGEGGLAKPFGDGGLGGLGPFGGALENRAPSVVRD